MKDCLFCKVASGDIPSACLYEDQQVFAFKDIDPKAPVHFLVIPKRHMDSAADINEDNSGLAAHCFEVIARLAKELQLDGFRVVTNCGASAGQSVKHLHFHVLSGRDMTWPPG
jgi:histidine triad (HIT) family protein